MRAQKRKNVLLILTDQHRRDTLGCYGASTCRTPNLDALAARGVRFDNMYTPTSPCSPARASLFTGLYPHKTHVPTNGGVLNPEARNLAEGLCEAGYQIGYAGKWHVDRDLNPTDYGFVGKDFSGYGYPAAGGIVDGLRFGGAWRPERNPHYEAYLKDRDLEAPHVIEAFYGKNPGKQTQEMYALQSGDIESSFECMVAEFAIDLMDQFQAAQMNPDDEQPFFIWANFWGPHTPCLIPEPYYSMYRPDDIPQEPSFCETWENKPRCQALYERFWGLDTIGWEGWREIVARYWGYVTMIDDLVGRMVDALRERGLLEDTIVAFATDHGDMMGAHRLIEKGPFMYDECYRLPLVVAHPDCENPGSACDEFVYLHDMNPTILDVAGAQPLQEPDSQSILANILGRDEPTGRDSAYSAFAAQILPMEQRMVRTRDWKFVYNRSDMGELYDMNQDPYELRNLFGMPEFSAIQRELMDMLREHLVRVGDPILRPYDQIRHVY